MFIEGLLLFVMVGGVTCGLFVGVVFANKISSSINETIVNLSNSSNFLTTSANNIKCTSEKLSEASSEQDASLHESSASLDEISSMIKMTADNAVKSNKLATESLERASTGKDVVREMNNSMESINNSIDTIVKEFDSNNDKMKNISSLISSIDEKTQVINDIVFQTKLLSFNASVEAARAGESGKGFAVVAEEVGNLAQMSGGAAIEITEMLSSSVIQVNSMIKESQERFSQVVEVVRNNVSNGTTIAKECDEILESIVTSVAGVSSSIVEISSATQEQSSGVSQLQTGISHIDGLSQANTSVAQDASQISIQLQEQVVTMNQSIQSIKEIILGTFTAKDKKVQTDKPKRDVKPTVKSEDDFFKKAA